MIRKLAVATVFTALAVPAFADDCAVTIEATDAMTWDTSHIDVKQSCEKFTVNLKHVGKLPASTMGHNWVLSKTADYQAVAQEGMAQGAEKNYVNDADERVLAHTEVVGGGEETSVTFDVSKLAADEEYSYFCSFPGHFAMMNGTLKLVD
ncbi:azurin [Thiopseudomonas alkaliphila]|uniref:Azurin n=1 Tax=Thiopseudomonas alkaliphila TaxID=1697053 RepID=A0A0K1XE64_9GAMM|nr:azurin [Thiopseudomonas alkaliphila]AKX59462.1 azurin [Thiopseudomonas alkaliphila]MDM1696049.1 azurin [Thiopseudomonas alkaliphila]MDM1716602.1 azurin [Thiopseudomonas alkaliphila]